MPIDTPYPWVGVGSLTKHSQMKYIKVLSFIVISLFFYACDQTKEQTALSKVQPPNFDVDINQIIGRLTLEEKVGQMTNLTLATIADEGTDRKLTLDPEKMEEVFLKYHVGSIQNVISGAYEIDQWHTLIQQLQDYTLTKTNHKIPFLYCIDAVHGANYILGGTQFPHNLALGATRNKKLVKAAAAVTAAETRAAGIRYNFSPVLDAGRNQLWSRLGETFGEDTYIVKELGKASIEGFEGNSLINSPTVASTMKHFVGYSDPKNGKDRAPAYIPEIVLREYYLPQFQEAIKIGSKTLMVNSGELNGVPLHANKYLLTDVLRGELGFKGMIISDWQDILKMHERHQVASSHKEAVYLAINAGIDMVIVPYTFDFTEDLIELVKEGRISEDRINESVGRILTLKKQVGLFENPNVEEELKPYFRKPEYQETALQAARESLVLLKNEGDVLPLKKGKKVLLTGPTAKHASALHGAWSYTWQGYKEALYPDSIKSVKAAFSGASYVKSLEFDKPKGSYRKLLASAKNHEVIVLCLGEKSYAETPGNIPDLAFPEDQVDLVKQLAKTGKPIVLVLLEGRPRIIRDIEPFVDAILVGFWPGSKGAEAIHEVIYGDYNPSGKLPITYPRYSGTLLTYDHKRLDEAIEKDDPYDYSYEFNPQFKFGDGLSYTTFQYSQLTTSADTVVNDLKISITVKNTGQKDGQEAIELYTRDWYASVTPSVKRLRRFEKIFLKAGEEKTIDFILNKKDVSFIDPSYKVIFEPGNFDILIGSEKKVIYWK